MSSIQVLRFPRSDWGLQEATQWAANHGFEPIKISMERNRWNFRLEDPSHFDHFATKVIRSRSHLGKPVYLVFGFRSPTEY